MSGTKKVLAQYAGIICVEDVNEYETQSMASYRAWKIAESVHAMKPERPKKKGVDLLKKQSHLLSCSHFLNCSYD